MNALDVFKIEKRENLHIIGISGGIASGKTTVADSFVKLGAHIINADKLVHEILQEEHVQKQIGQKFPQTFSNGAFQKQILAKEVFSSQQKLKDLESILHPLVRSQMHKKLQSLADGNTKKLVIVDAPLLWENGLHKGVDTLIFIDTPLHLRRKRAQVERNWNEKEVEKREHFQISLSTKKEGSDYIINNENESVMKQQVENIWKKINTLFFTPK